jgi:two-component system OmpR family sensor kinase/two-component system sensor histidine kinase BaeS
MRGHFFRRIGCVFLLLMLFAFGAFTILFWLVANASGVVNLSESVLAAMRTVGIVIALLVLAGILFGGRELRRTALPIGDMLEAAGRIADGDYSARVDERGPREVRALARAFNAMAARLQAEDEQRRNLLADVSHELRTPITVIQGNLEGLLDGIYPADRQHIAPILEETRVLSRVIDDLRTLSLADSGALKLHLESTDIRDLIDEAAASFRLQAGASGVDLRVDVQAGLPRLDIDPTRIREVLVNLLANALRYTSSGGQIAVHGWLDESDGERVYISVKDTGVGIAVQDLPHIFERFYKTDESRGTGLGLAIARSLVLAHGGEISAESEVGVGTKILFTLPA